MIPNLRNTLWPKLIPLFPPHHKVPSFIQSFPNPGGTGHSSIPNMKQFIFPLVTVKKIGKTLGTGGGMLWAGNASPKLTDKQTKRGDDELRR
jgi:hypothetical protein